MSTSALLINYNSNGSILKSIQALVSQDHLLESILVIDNGSTDGDIQRVRQAFPHVEVIELGHNHGLSHARNIGLKQLKSDLVLLIDDDMYLSKDALGHMVNALHETDAVVVCPRFILYPQTETIQFDGAAIHFSGTLRLLHTHQPVSDHPPTRKQTLGFGGACLLIKRETLAKAGYFDEDYFFYFEDLELSYRLSALGHSIYCEERAVVMHDLGTGTENLSFRETGSYPARRAYFTLRNRWLTIAIHYQVRTLLLLAPALMIYELAAFVEALRRRWLREYLQALYSLFLSANRIIKKRKHQQSNRIVNDGAILTGGDLPFARGFVDQKISMPVKVLNFVLNAYWKWIKRWL